MDTPTDDDWVLDPDPQTVHFRTTLEVEGPWIIERTWLCTNARRVAPFDKCMAGS